MKRCFALFTILTIACINKNQLHEQKASQETEFVTNDTIPNVRAEVSKTPVASYVIPINNPLLHQYFGAQIFETPLTFQFLLQLQYEGVLETDTLKIPNFGTAPIVQIKKGPEKMSCIIGFLDKQKRFKEYKMLTAKENKLKLKVLHHYFVGSYRTEY